MRVAPSASEHASMRRSSNVASSSGSRSERSADADAAPHAASAALAGSESGP